MGDTILTAEIVDSFGPAENLATEAALHPPANTPQENTAEPEKPAEKAAVPEDEHGEDEDEAEEKKANTDEDSDEDDDDKPEKKSIWRFELAQLHTLCEYLLVLIRNILFDYNIYFRHELQDKQLSQFIPDLVTFCAFVGNDFIRPLPNYDIFSGSLDLLFSLYKMQAPDFKLVLPNYQVIFGKCKF